MEEPKTLPRALHKEETPGPDDLQAVGQPTTRIEGKTVLDNEAGKRFYHKHLSPKARKRKAKGRAQARRARQRNRRRS